MSCDCVCSLAAKLKKVKKKKKRGEGDSLDEGLPYIPKIFAKFSHDAQLPVVKKKHLTIEQLNARRRKVWLTIAKKEIPKVSVSSSLTCAVGPFSPDYPFTCLFKSFKQKTSARNLVLTNAKKVSGRAATIHSSHQLNVELIKASTSALFFFF